MHESVVLAALAALAMTANAIPLIAETNAPNSAAVPALTAGSLDNRDIGPADFSFPGYDTLRWCDYNSNSSGQTIRGYLAGYGVKLTPAYYPAVVTGAYSRVYILNTDSAQIALVDDDGASGAPGSNLCKWDTLVPVYSGEFFFRPIRAPACTLWDGDFYLFVLGRHHNLGGYSLNWLHDGTRNAPNGTYWLRDSLGNYASATPGGDFQMCAVVEYHDVEVESIGGFPASDTVYAESTYQPWLLLHELAGFSEENVPLVLSIGGIHNDTMGAGVHANNRSRTVLGNWQVHAPAGTYDCAWYSALRSDTRTSNDTIRFRLTVAPPQSGSRESPGALPLSGISVIGPNPVTRGIVLLRVGRCGMARVRAAVYGATGERMLERCLTAGSDGCAWLDLSSLGAGVYVVRVETDGCVALRKLVIE
jgi:hypothetical protein